MYEKKHCAWPVIPHRKATADKGSRKNYLYILSLLLQSITMTVFHVPPLALLWVFSVCLAFPWLKGPFHQSFFWPASQWQQAEPCRSAVQYGQCELHLGVSHAPPKETHFGLLVAATSFFSSLPKAHGYSCNMRLSSLFRTTVWYRTVQNDQKVI